MKRMYSETTNEVIIPVVGTAAVIHSDSPSLQLKFYYGSSILYFPQNVKPLPAVLFSPFQRKKILSFFIPN